MRGPARARSARLEYVVRGDELRPARAVEEAKHLREREDPAVAAERRLQEVRQLRLRAAMRAARARRRGGGAEGGVGGSGRGGGRGWGRAWRASC